MIDGYALTELHAQGPHPDLEPGLSLFGQFIGTWTLRVRFFDAAGEVSVDESGTWSFGWVLDGRAIQDVLTYPRAGSAHPGERGIGTSLRHYDATTETWSVFWLGAVSGTRIFLTAKATDEGIRLEGRDVDGSPLNWAFTDITPDSFHWQGRIQDPEGTWRLEQDMLARRIKDH
ncbi:hypothetical protein [Natronoglycomyces albus]|uniref:DUF1579 domain-containing protein n=1 Tax=Natronoglycomyces albus TaxID=2811108 RepID=A0A895XNH9_9ACTN|nr:hypothetical protein [Natronoglycomyces albus]QSB04939.1 hypothetical protein JQS30_14410 [Natronoglycomyces albus]